MTLSSFSFFFLLLFDCQFKPVSPVCLGEGNLFQDEIESPKKSHHNNTNSNLLWLNKSVDKHLVYFWILYSEGGKSGQCPRSESIRAHSDYEEG